MSRPGAGHEIPEDALPEGFAESVDEEPERPAEPRPAATVVLLREGKGAPEVLLLRRNRSAGFVPGAFVFPGGRVDRDDASAALVERLDGLTAADAAARLGLPEDADPPGVAYFLAAVREAFEETGILVGRTGRGVPPPGAGEKEEVLELRERLLDDDSLFPEVLDRLGCRVDGASVEYVAHWITPVQEPRRYDTRFFAAAVPRGREAVLDRREMVEAVWLTPDEALERNEGGGLPMVFPTIRTLESLRPFSGPDEVLKHFRSREIPTVLPRLVRTPTGVGIEVDDEEPAG